MENKSTFSSALQFGLLTGIVMAGYTLLLFLVGIDVQTPWNLVSYILYIVGLYWGISQIREKQLNGIMSYGKAFVTGFYITIFIALVLAVFSYFYLKEINPGALAEAITKAEDKILASNPDISDEDLQKAMHMVKVFANPGISAISKFISNLFVGTIFSLIIAIFAKREDRTIA